MNKVIGNIHLSPGKSFQTNYMNIHELVPYLKDDKNKLEQTTWKRFFFSQFPGTTSKSHSSNEHLYIILDGLDEALDQEKLILMQFLADLKKEKPKVSVLLTSRQEEIPGMESLKPLIIDVNKENALADIKTLIRRRLHTLPRLRKFSPALKRRILRKVAKKADSTYIFSF